MLVVFDIDGTIADCAHRLHYIQQTPPDWEAFRGALWRDAPISPLIETWRALADNGHTILTCSGRDKASEAETWRWLKAYDLVPDGAYFRPTGDYRPDYVVKEELLQQIIADWGMPQIVFEDRKLCVDMWRRAGIICCQVAEGDY